jgi:L-fucose isomerase-like protein
MVSYVGEGHFTDDRLDTFGGYGVIEVPRFEERLRLICTCGFEHHVAATRALGRLPPLTGLTPP